MTNASPGSSPSTQRVLFVSRDTSSPEIAASLLRHAAGDLVDVATASTELADPTGRSDEMLVAMGLDPADKQRLTTGALNKSEWVVALDADLDVARVSGSHYEEWDLEHDDLVARVEGMSRNLTTATANRHLQLTERLQTFLKGATRRLRPRRR